MKNVLYTIGSSDRSEAEFIGLLQSKGVTRLFDVRTKTGSRVLHFDESRYRNLSKMLTKHGIVYDDSLHLKLGGMQNGKMTVGNFRIYTATEEYRKALNELKEKVSANDGACAILCCERNPKTCHRQVIGQTLAIQGWQISELC